MNTRIAVSIEESPNGEIRVADHFGRCTKFLVYEINEDKKVTNEKSYQNPLQSNHGGACELPNYIKEMGANVVIAGGMGSKAIALFNQLGIQVITAPGLQLEEALFGYMNGELKDYDECSGHHGNYNN